MKIPYIKYNPENMSRLLEEAKQQLTEMDSNHDKQISVQEFLEMTKVDFVQKSILLTRAIHSTQDKQSQSLSKEALSNLKRFLKKLNQADSHAAHHLAQTIIYRSHGNNDIAQIALAHIKHNSQTKGLVNINQSQAEISHLLSVITSSKDPLLVSILQIHSKRPQIKFTIMTHENKVGAIKDHLKQNGAKIECFDFIELPNETYTSPNTHIWPQDPFDVMITKDEEIVLLQSTPITTVVPINNRNIGFHSMAYYVANQYNWKVVPHINAIDGGNKIFQDQTLFIGAGEFTEQDIMQSEFGIALEKENYLKDLKQTYGIENVIEIESQDSKQALGHIDTFVSFPPNTYDESGKPVALIGSVQLANQIVNDIDIGQLTSYETALKEKDIRIGDHSGFLTQTQERSQPLKQETKLQSDLDQHAQKLIEDGYHVERIPLFSPDSKFEDYDKFPFNPFLTYTNVMYDTDINGNLRVLLPSYDIPELDEYTKDLYESLGIQTDPIWIPISRSKNRGSLRCSFKILSRKED